MPCQSGMHSQLMVILQQLLQHGWRHMAAQVHIPSCHRQLGIMDSIKLNSVVIFGNGTAGGFSVMVISYELAGKVCVCIPQMGW